jgi:hypothetical protein
VPLIQAVSIMAHRKCGIFLTTHYEVKDNSEMGFGMVAGETTAGMAN